MIVSVGGRHLCLGVHDLDGIDNAGIAKHNFALHSPLTGPLMAVREISADIKLTSTINVGKKFTLHCVLLIEKAATPFSNIKPPGKPREERFEVASAKLADSFFQWGFPNVAVSDDNTLELVNKAIERVALCTPTLLASQTPQLSRTYRVNDGLDVTITYAKPFLDTSSDAIKLAKEGKFNKLYNLCCLKLRHNDKLKMEMLSAHYQFVEFGRQSLYDQLCYWVNYLEFAKKPTEDPAERKQQKVSADNRDALENMCLALDLTTLYSKCELYPTESSFVDAAIYTNL